MPATWKPNPVLTRQDKPAEKPEAKPAAKPDAKSDKKKK